MRSEVSNNLKDDMSISDQSNSTKKIFIVAGEASGDLYGAALVRDLMAVRPHFDFYGMGGEQMSNAGVKLLVQAKELAIMGFSDVIKKIFKIFRAFQRMKKAVLREKPELIILIDYPGFNLRLAKMAQQAGVKVLYYISPQLWAWRKNRIKTIKKYVDCMAVILPFEEEIYRKAQVPAAFVGHPLLKIVKPTISREEAKLKFGLNQEDKIVGLMPGSRIKEIKYLLPVMIKAAEIIKAENKNVEFILVLAPSLDEKNLSSYIEKSKVPIRIIKGASYDVMQVCDVIIAASGTVTLEIALLGAPMVIAYKMSAFNHYLAKKLVRVPYIGLCNLILGKKIVKEFIQERANPESIVLEINKILNDSFYRSKITTGLSMVKRELGAKAKTNMTELILKMLS